MKAKSKTIKLPANILTTYMPLLRDLAGNKANKKYHGVYIDATNASLYSSDGERDLNFKILDQSIVDSLPKDFPKIALNGSVVGDLVRSGGSQGEWSLEVLDSHISFKKSKLAVKLLMMDLELEYDQQKFEASMSMAGSDLKQGIKAVMFAVGDSVQNIIMQGVQLSILKDKLEIAATDGYRIALYVKSQEFKEELSCVLSKRSMSILMQLLDHTQSSVQITKQENKFVFMGVGEHNIAWTFHTSVMAGKFPDYHPFFTEKYTDVCVCNAKELYDGINKLSVIVRDSQIVTLVFANNTIKVRSAHVNIGEGENVVVGEFSGSQIVLNFRLSILMNVLQAFGNQQIKIHVREKGTILCNSDTSDSQYVISPIMYPSH